MPADTGVLSPWPASIAYISRLDVHDLLGRTNPLPFQEPRGVWTRRNRVDIAHALREKWPVIIPRIRHSAAVPSPDELAEEWIREFDTRPFDAVRATEIHALMDEYALVTVPIQSFVRALVQPPPEPFHLLVLKSWAKLPRLRIEERDGALRVLCAHQAPVLIADLEVRLQLSDGTERWLSPSGIQRPARVLAQSDLLIADSGSKEFELCRVPLSAEITGARARLENPGATGASEHDGFGSEATWKR
jgi:hypothetical protein